MTNEQTLLQTVLLLHKIQVPSPHQIDSEKTFRMKTVWTVQKNVQLQEQPKNQDFASNCIDRNVRKRYGPVWTSNSKLHSTTVEETKE